MLELINGYWTFNGSKYDDLSRTGKIAFNLLLKHKKNNLIMLHNKINITTFVKQNKLITKN